MTALVGQLARDPYRLSQLFITDIKEMTLGLSEIPALHVKLIFFVSECNVFEILILC